MQYGKPNGKQSTESKIKFKKVNAAKHGLRQHEPLVNIDLWGQLWPVSSPKRYVLVGSTKYLLKTAKISSFHSGRFLDGYTKNSGLQPVRWQAILQQTPGLEWVKSYWFQQFTQWQHWKFVLKCSTVNSTLTWDFCLSILTCKSWDNKYICWHKQFTIIISFIIFLKFDFFMQTHRKT